MEEVYGGCTDTPDDRDFSATHVLGAPNSPSPDSIDLLNTESHNQGQTRRCTAYALTHVHEILQRIEHQFKIELDADEQWKNQRPGGATEAGGDSLQNALSTLAKNGLKDNYGKTEDGFFRITKYAKVDQSFDGWKARLAQKLPIFTGAIVTATNFVNAKKTGYFTGNDGRRKDGHAFAVVGYENDELVCLNSADRKWGFFRNGTFKIKRKDWTGIFSGYVLYDKQDLEMIFRDVSENSPFAKEIKEMLDYNIMKGDNNSTIPDAKDRFFRPNAPVTRGELAVILSNFRKSLK